MNTREIENELAAAIDDDLRRQNVNSAKLRASSQAVPYEQFKQFVAAANLRPLDKDQNLMFVKDRKVASVSSNVPYLDKPTIRTQAENKASQILSSASKAVRSAHSFAEFEKSWNCLANDVAGRASFLSIHSESELVKIFEKSSIDFGLIGDILSAVSHAVSTAQTSVAKSSDSEASVTESLDKLSLDSSKTLNAMYFVLKVISQSKRFTFTYACIGSKEQNLATSALASLRQAVDKSMHMPELLAFSGTDIDTLLKLYK